jgi:hypothetical protein
MGYGDSEAKINLAKLVFPLGVRYLRSRDTFEPIEVNDGLSKVFSLVNQTHENQY